MKKFETTIFEPKFATLPTQFDGFCVVHIADLHNFDYKGALELEITKHSPDIIFITGDSVHHENCYENTLQLIRTISNVAPVYFVTGNHEGRFKSYPDLRKQLQDAEAIVLENESVMLSRDDSQIALIGIHDPKFFENKNDFKNELAELVNLHKDDFKILLSHRPEHFKLYNKMGYDLVFAGHAHGGQVRFPWIGALFAPGQGLFPKYVNGLCSDGKCNMVVSRGLGQTRKTLPRICNKPELQIVRLKYDTN